ncbi:MAG: HAMP domain-containing sensor histidine kinase, partial [Pseudomonadota bacterium]
INESQEIPSGQFSREGSEFRPLFLGFNELVRAERERSQFEKRLYEEEKLASLGRLTSGIAHEINNPLGGMFSALDTLERHGEKPGVRAKTVSLLKRGLSGIRDVVSSALLTYRPPQAPTPLQLGDLEDIRLLLRPELRRRRISLDWNVDVEAGLPVDSTPVRQILLNLLLNSCAASDPGSSIACTAIPYESGIRLTIQDNGPGLPAQALTFLNSQGPVSAPITDAAGLGLWIVKRLASETGGTVKATNPPGGGACITVQIAGHKEQLQDVA